MYTVHILFIASFVSLLLSVCAVVYVVAALRSVKPAKKESERRLKDYPSSFPYGWYKLADSRDLKPGDKRHVETLGKQFVLFRGLEDKKVGVLDAFCIHLGANLAVGGTVVGDCIQCPFHLWEFDTNGKCQKIPYQEQIPERAQATSYHTIEYYGMVLMWYDNQMRPPKYFPPAIPDMDSGNMVYCNKVQRDIGMHLLEIAENSADFRHFETLHCTMNLPYTQIPLPIKIVHVSDWKLGEFDRKDPHLIHFRDTAHIQIFGKNVPNTTAVAEITFVGPSSLMLFKFNTPAGTIVLFQTHLPIDHLNSHTEIVWYAEKRVWKALAWYVVGNWISQWQNDINIWENKTFVRKPFLVKGDGPIMKLRRWFFQFYDTDVAYETEESDEKDRSADPKSLKDVSTGSDISSGDAGKGKPNGAAPSTVSKRGNTACGVPDW